MLIKALVNCIRLYIAFTFGMNTRRYFTVLASLALSCSAEEECSWFDDEFTYYCGYNGLTSIPGDIPEDTVELLLYENQISSIPPGVFSALSACTDLEMRRNNLTEIGARAFEGFDTSSNYYTDSRVGSAVIRTLELKV